MQRVQKANFLSKKTQVDVELEVTNETRKSSCSHSHNFHSLHPSLSFFSTEKHKGSKIHDIRTRNSCAPSY